MVWAPAAPGAAMLVIEEQAVAQAGTGKPTSRLVLRAAAGLGGAAIAIALLTCSRLRPPLDPNTAAHTTSFAGKARSWYLHVPPALQPLQPAPLVIALHGGGGRARSLESFTHLSALADREGFLVAYPQGEGHNWYDGRETDTSEAHRTKRDDAGFIAAMIEQIDRVHRVDRKRIYATGISNGGMFAHYLAGTLHGTFAAIAPVVGGMADPWHTGFAPKEPVAVMIVQGTADPLVPYGGGEVARDRGRVIPTEETVRKWVAANGCTSVSATDHLPDRDPDDGCTGERTMWTSCRGGADVELITLRGGGHTWPGGTQYLPERVIGTVCRDFDGAAAIWEFFKAHPKP